MMEMLSFSDFERYALGKLGKAGDAYYYSGCYKEQTLQDNVAAFSRYRFRPRVLRDVSKIDMSTTILGHPVSCPVGVAPVAMCCLAHPDGEVGIAKACSDHHLLFGLSTNASMTIEDIAAGAPHSAKWFQIFIFKQRDLTESLVRRAEKAGFSALVLTVDTPVGGRRLVTMQEQFAVPQHLKFANIETADGDLNILRKACVETPYLQALRSQLDASVTWDDVTWLMSITRLPVILKGIMTGEDAREAVSHGVAAIWVSNHGGRQLDGVPATLDVLSEVVGAVAGHCEVYLDGGVRSGYDVIKAVALGAKAVFIGRPVLWGLVYKGTEGVASLLELVKTEITNAMALLGVRKLDELNGSYVIHESLLPRL